MADEQNKTNRQPIEIVPAVECNSVADLKKYVVPGAKQWARHVGSKKLILSVQVPYCDEVFSAVQGMDLGLVVIPQFKVKLRHDGTALWEHLFDERGWHGLGRVVSRWVNRLAPPAWAIDTENPWSKWLYPPSDSHPDGLDDVAFLAGCETLPNLFAGYPAHLPMIQYPGIMSAGHDYQQRQMVWLRYIRQTFPKLCAMLGDYCSMAAMGDRTKWAAPREFLELFGIQRVPLAYCCIDPPETAQPNEMSPRYALPREMPWLTELIAYDGYRQAVAYPGVARFVHAPRLWAAAVKAYRL